jgi:DNA topoisomerase-3
MRDKKIGPLEGFRSKAGWPFVAEMALKYNEEEKNWKLEFDFGDDKKNEESGEIVEFTDESLGVCPKCGGAVHEHGSNYVCSKAVPTNEQPTPSCDFKTGKLILQQPVEREQVVKLLTNGKTDVLDKFVSNRTRRSFKAMLAWNPEEGKVTFEFEPREGGKKYPPRKTAATKTPFGKAAAKKTTAKTAAAKTTKAPAAKKATKPAAEKAPRKAAVGTLKPSPALMAVIGDGTYARTEVVKKIWDYIKANNLQDPADKRSIKADGKLQAVLGKDSATMFELAGIIGKHLS